MKNKILLLAILLLPACDGDDNMRSAACEMAFDDTLACHQYKVQEACWAICDELTAECQAADPEEPYPEGCNAVSTSCRDKCYGFWPDDPTRFGAYPERTDEFYKLYQCQSQEDRELVCS